MKNPNTFEGQDFPSSSVVFTDSLATGFSNTKRSCTTTLEVGIYKRKAPKKLWDIIESHADHLNPDSGHGMNEEETDEALMKFLKSLFLLP